MKCTCNVGLYVFVNLYMVTPVISLRIVAEKYFQFHLIDYEKKGQLVFVLFLFNGCLPIFV